MLSGYPASVNEKQKQKQQNNFLPALCVISSSMPWPVLRMVICAIVISQRQLGMLLKVS